MKPHRLQILTLTVCLILIALSAAQPALAQTGPNPLFIPILFNQACQPKVAIQPTSGEASEQAILDAINAERALRGLPVYTESASLERIARFHSNDMAANNFFSHDGSAPGETYSTRVSWLCERYSTWGEIIGWNSNGDTAWMMSGWMGSTGHRDAILNTKYTVMGAGYAIGGGRHLWTVDFGLPSGLKAPQLQGEPICETTLTGDTQAGTRTTICTYAEE